MITKKEILQKIATKEIKSLDQIEKKYLQDEDIFEVIFNDGPPRFITRIK